MYRSIQFGVEYCQQNPRENEPKVTHYSGGLDVQGKFLLVAEASAEYIFIFSYPINGREIGFQLFSSRVSCENVFISIERTTNKTVRSVAVRILMMIGAERFLDQNLFLEEPSEGKA